MKHIVNFSVGFGLFSIYRNTKRGKKQKRIAINKLIRVGPIWSHSRKKRRKMMRQWRKCFYSLNPANGPLCIEISKDEDSGLSYCNYTMHDGSIRSDLIYGVATGSPIGDQILMPS